MLKVKTMRNGRSRKSCFIVGLALAAAAAPVEIAPGAVGVRITNACAQEGGRIGDGGEDSFASCAPKPDWDCIQGNYLRGDKCDPNDKGCIT
ncbi:MAG TPA: hypothetical protein VHG08_20770 [Longimicrobium sp.]|nr:hypothetical protein [Longimicrobium sp.]